jgi:predicted glutamine amidotransferase
LCRILALWTKQENFRHSARYIIREWLKAWQQSTKYDPNLEHAFRLHPNKSNHPHGWGVVSLGTNLTKNINWIQTNYDFNPAYIYQLNNLTRPILTSQLLRTTNNILLVHARRASPNTPLTSKQIQPLLISNNNKMIYICHNGSVNSSVINEALSKDHKISHSKLKEYSDTQILNRFIFQRLQNENSEVSTDSTDFWIETFKELIQMHKFADKSYRMNLLILEINEKDPRIISCSALSKDSLHLSPYYQFFIVKGENCYGICSSTVADYFKIPRRTMKWEIKTIPNKYFVSLTSDYQFQHRRLN